MKPGRISRFGQVSDRDAGVAPRDLGEGAEVRDDAVLDHQQAVGTNRAASCSCPDVLPGVVDEVYPSAADIRNRFRQPVFVLTGDQGGDYDKFS